MQSHPYIGTQQTNKQLSNLRIGYRLSAPSPADNHNSLPALIISTYRDMHSSQSLRNAHPHAIEIFSVDAEGIASDIGALQKG